MKTIRRLYMYAVAFIGIEVVLWGTIGLLRSIFDTQQIGRSSTNLAQSLALVLVGIPIFLIHWYLAQNAAAKDAEERSSTLRALFLYGILLATLVAATQNLLALLNRTMLQAAQLSSMLAIAGGSQSWMDNIIAILANLAAAAYFHSILRADRRALAERERFDDVRRLYRIVWVSYGLILIIFGAQQALIFAFGLPSSVMGSIRRETALNAIALLITGAPVWFYAWRALQSALHQPEERDSYLRLGFIYLLAMTGLVVTMVSAGQVLYQLLLRLLGGALVWREFQQDLSGPLSIGIPLAVVWAYYRGWLDRQISFDPDPARQAGKHRLSIYLRALLGLSAAVFGLLSLVSVLVPIVLGSTFLGAFGLREPLAGALASLAIGLLVWLLAWREAQAQLAGDESAAGQTRRSLVRKVYLYLVIFGSVIGLMVSAGNLIFSLVSAALGGTVNDLPRTVLQNLANLLVFGLLLFYHLSILRAEGSARAGAVTERQAQFRLLVLDADGSLSPSIQAALARRQLNFSLVSAGIEQPLPAEPVEMVVLSSALALDLPEHAHQWLRAHTGALVIVNEPAAREIWVDGPDQAAEAARAIFEGGPHNARPSPARTPVWTYVAYVFAVLFGIQVLFILLTLGISLAGAR